MNVACALALHFRYYIQLFKFDNADQIVILWQMKTETLDMPSDLITASYCTHIKITLTMPVGCHNNYYHQRPAPSYLHSCNCKSSMLYATDICYINLID